MMSSPDMNVRHVYDAYMQLEASSEKTRPVNLSKQIRDRIKNTKLHTHNALLLHHHYVYVI
jgi:hypothetical protein